MYVYIYIYTYVVIDHVNIHMIIYLLFIIWLKTLLTIQAPVSCNHYQPLDQKCITPEHHVMG